MMKILSSFAHLADDELLVEIRRLATCERQATAQLIASLAELDARRLYLGQGCSSLFTYCTQVLRLSEHAAYGRIEAARAARRFPAVLELLANGSVTLTTVGLLAPHLTPENHRGLLNSASHKSKRDVEHMVASLRPLPPVASTVRKLPSPKPPEIVRDHQGIQTGSAVSSAPYIAPPPARPAAVGPLAPDRYKVQFTISRDTYDKLRRAQDLLRHSNPSGDPAAIFDRALTLLLANLEKTKLAATERPRTTRESSPGSRHIPAAVKRQVWARDGGQCAFVGSNGRCTERGFLEFHHVMPYATGGSTTVENLELRCRSHNAHEAELRFGRLLVKEARTSWNDPTRSGPSSGLAAPCYAAPLPITVPPAGALTALCEQGTGPHVL
jgi:5-methylcytosine-specific restriction endonuclease McrA